MAGGLSLRTELKLESHTKQRLEIEVDLEIWFERLVILIQLETYP